MKDDVALVAAARAGDRAAFAELFERHRPLLRGLCRRLLGVRGAVDDVEQEAALQAWLALDALRRADRFGPWLAGIGLNLGRRWLGRDRGADWSWEALVGGGQIDEPIDQAAGPADLAEAAELSARVRRAVDELPRGQRAAVLLFYLGGLTHAETAAALGIEVGAVKTRLHKARASLRARLRSLWRGDDPATRTEENVATDTGKDWIEARIAEVRRRAARDGEPIRHVVFLEEIGGTRTLPIWIGEAEALALVGHLEKIEAPRPQTFAFAARLLEAAGGRLVEVRVSRLHEEVFYAEVVVDGPVGVRTFDARPSDALNLALQLGAPIRIAAEVIEAQATTVAAAAPPAGLPDMRDESTVGTAELAAEIREKLAQYPRPSSAPAPEAKPE